MFEPVIKRAENAVSATITRVSGNAMAAVPLLLAFGFATAAAAWWAIDAYGPLIGNLVIAGAFLVIALFVISWACTAFGISCAEYFKHHHNHQHMVHHS